MYEIDCFMISSLRCFHLIISFALNHCYLR